jgi:hypothetical protein
MTLNRLENTAATAAAQPGDSLPSAYAAALMYKLAHRELAGRLVFGLRLP